MKKFYIFFLITVFIFSQSALANDIYSYKYNGEQWERYLKNAEKSSVDFEIENNIAFLKINKFAKGTYDEFIKAMKETDIKKIDNIIFDLRNNKGGFIDEAVAITSDLMEKDYKYAELIYDNGKEKEYIGTGKYANKKICVLVNEITASASEFMALSLKETKRAIVIGNITYGKSRVQKNIKTQNGGERFTVGKYIVNEKDIEGKGITPDICVNNENKIYYDDIKKEYLFEEIDIQREKAQEYFK